MGTSAPSLYPPVIGSSFSIHPPTGTRASLTTRSALTSAAPRILTSPSGTAPTSALAPTSLASRLGSCWSSSSTASQRCQQIVAIYEAGPLRNGAFEELAELVHDRDGIVPRGWVD